jgi:ATP-binding cassette subfamily C protein LapB
MKHTDIPQDENDGQALAQWAQAFGFVATATAWPVPRRADGGRTVAKGKPMVPALTQLAREAGLSFQPLETTQAASTAGVCRWWWRC